MPFIISGQAGLAPHLSSTLVTSYRIIYLQWVVEVVVEVENIGRMEDDVSIMFCIDQASVYPIEHQSM